MKKIMMTIVAILSVFMITACEEKKISNEEKKDAALIFKEEYESLNGKENTSGKVHRTVHIPEDNPYEKVSQKKVVKMLENNETFYLYVGDSMCPWCRSVLEKSIEVANNKNIQKIYYIDIWDDEGNEILRDKYELVDGTPSKVSDGTEEYQKLLKTFDSVLSDYTLTDEEGNKIEVGEKRIFAPNYFYIEDGKVKKMVEGISEKQKDSREELTDEMLKDEEEIFKNFFV